MALSAEGRERLRQQILKNKPWLHAHKNDHKRKAKKAKRAYRRRSRVERVIETAVQNGHAGKKPKHLLIFSRAIEVAVKEHKVNTLMDMLGRAVLLQTFGGR